MEPQLSKALLALQKDMPTFQKDAINPHFKNTYISLDKLMDGLLPKLHEHGFVLLQGPDQTVHGQPAIKTQLIHAATGQSVEGLLPLVLDKDTSQAQGSAMTYARRYALMSLLGLVADEDDDGEKASKPKRTVKRPSPTNTIPENDKDEGGYF